jgi:ABC-type glycerol-3-phosphate transport system substrate-binding protein
LKGKSLFAVIAAALALALGLAACGEDDDEESAGTGTGTQEEQTTPAPTGPAAETVKLSETEFNKAGVVEFDVTNDGSVTHALEVEGGDIEEETEDIAAGDSATLKVDLPKGVYELYCPIDDHKEQGMTAELRVAGATGTAEDSGDESSEDDSSEDDSSSSGY